MKIAIVCYPTFGGSGVVATELGLTLANRGHEIHFITYKQPVRLAMLTANLHFHEVNVPEYPLFHYQPYELALSSKLVDVVKQHQIEILHVHYAIPHAYAAYMAKQMLLDDGIRIPIITTLHGTDITLVGSHPFYKPAVTFSINHSDAVTAVSQSLKDDTLKEFDIKVPIHVIHNFIDTASKVRDEQACARRFDIASPEERVITHISNFRKIKRIPDVIKVFAKLQAEIPAKLLLVGDGPERDKAERLVAKLGIESKVLFLGNSNEIDKILSISDLFILPSETESFGLAALEAMVWGVPVISSNVGGLPEINSDGETGFLSPVADVEDMAEKALRILKDDATLAGFRAKAKAQAARFDIHEIVPYYESLYQEVLCKN